MTINTVDFWNKGLPAMFNPYPAHADLVRERVANQYLAEQAASLAAFHAALKEFAAKVQALSFPLGSPVVGYDMEDISSFVDDWSQTRDGDETAAMDKAREYI